MSKSVNISVSARLHEAGYRYRREQITVVHERFNGAITRITNLTTIAHQLQVTLDDLQHGLIKSLKRKMGISTCGPLTFPGHHTPESFDVVLQDMVERFVLCPVCMLPEWNTQVCRACGHSKGAAVPRETKTSVKNASNEKCTTHKGAKCVQATEKCLEEKEADVAPWEKRLSYLMHALYFEREQRDIVPERKRQVDRLLDECWKLDTETQFEHYRKAHPDFAQLLDKFAKKR
jgi:hypothetical protein